ncbi:MAG: hypothetical protein ACR2FH_02640 [Caulobacteraceae bacterium]
MKFLEDRRMILAVGAGVALALGLGAAALMASRHRDPPGPPPASQGGLVVQTGRDDDLKLDPRRPLRCFVGGRLVGELPLVDCARRNGVASGGLDVGLDASGALAGAHGLSPDITPLPPSPEVVASAAPADEPPAPEGGAYPGAAPSAPRPPTAPCLKYAEAGWRRLPYAATLEVCVRALYAGRCVEPGGALYGRWADRTLRLAPGRVEISDNNRDFRFLVGQGPGCSLPPAAPPRGY